MVEPKYTTISGLVQNALFRIPDFQRMYSWEKRQRRELFDDILSAAENNSEHFLSTIVCLRRGKKDIGTDVYEEFYVVDGQQRLTSQFVGGIELCSIGNRGRRWKSLSPAGVCR